MPKHFSNLPEELEQYNPEVFHTNKFSIETYDENGLMHSFNDAPSSVRRSYKNTISMFWYSHGESFRANNKPAYIELKHNSYRAYDENGLLHSYNDMPCIMAYENNEWHMSWYKHGVLHRDNELPAQASWKKTLFNIRPIRLEREAYFEEGILHRGSGLPALFQLGDQNFLVKGVVHNTTGHASFHKKQNKILSKKWSLYGVWVPERDFNYFKKLEEIHGGSPWSIFLLFLGMITEEDVKALNKTEDDYALPLPWVLRSLGVTHESFNKAVFAFYQQSYDIVSRFYQEGEYLAEFIKIVEYELSQAALVSKEKQELRLSYS